MAAITLLSPPRRQLRAGTNPSDSAAEGLPSVWPGGQGRIAQQECCIFPSLGLTFGEESASQVVLLVKNPPAIAGDIRDVHSIPGSGSSPGGGNVNPLQYASLENPVERGAWRAIVHGVTQSRTRLK